MENRSKSNLNNKAALYTLEGNYQKASELFESILSSEPDDITVLFNYGFNFLQWDKNNDALDAFKKIISLADEQKNYENSIFASVIEDCGTACYDSGLYKEAEIYLKIAESLDPDDSVLMNHLGVLYFVTERISEAEKYFEKAVRCDDENIDAWFNLADTYEVLGKTDESEKARKRFLELEELNK